jgi:dimeric dUTPase (all-alpha-NTP-PPase superfamily)
VDSLHFFLSIANHYQYDVDRLYDLYVNDFKPSIKQTTLVTAFKVNMEKILKMEKNQDGFHYIDAFAAYLNLGKMLGFNWDQIEQAYMRKNEINHKRQDNGY